VEETLSKMRLMGPYASVNQYDKARYVTFEFGNKAKGYMVEKNCN
jgi:hypothetical protein